MPIAKSGTCTATDTQLCYKTCGPADTGFKSETCNGSTYTEGACAFPAGDYTCYALPATAPAACPATAPQAGSKTSAGVMIAPCTVPTCTVCGGTSTAQTTGYLDSKGNANQGYCVCAGSTPTTMHWSCASTTAWPCPATMSGVTGC